MVAKSRLLVISFLILLMFPSIISSTARTSIDGHHEISVFESKNILFDESHCYNGSSLQAPGNASMLSAMLVENGYNSSTNFDIALDSGILADFDVLVIFHPREALTSGEEAAILTFVSNGGGLLLVGAQGGNNWGLDGAKLNPLAEEFGIEFNGDRVAGEITEFNANVLTTDLTKITTSSEGYAGESLTLTGSAQAMISASEDIVVASSEYDSGRVVCVGTPAPFLMYGSRSAEYEVSHFQFALNTFDWLTQNDHRTVVIPERFIISSGPGPSLNETEVEEYEMFVGLYHDHTTHSDGQNTPYQMLEKGMAIGLDFMVMTDHSYENPITIGGVTGAQTMQAITRTYGLDIQIIVGAELSRGEHTTGFPLTENIITSNQQAMVDGIHAQGGLATLCHPSGSYNYGDVYGAFETMGYDAFEVDNKGYFIGNGEDGFLHPYFGASDGHSVSFVGGVTNAVFVKNPTGPDGTISGEDIKEAVLDKRVVILDRINDLIYGQDVWINRWLDLQEEAEDAVETARNTIDTLMETEDVGIAELYLENAETAIAYWMNPSRAIRLANIATSEIVQSLSIDVSIEDAVKAYTDFDIAIEISNSYSEPISVNTTIYTTSGVSLDQDDQDVSVSSQSSSTISSVGHTASRGFERLWIVFRDFNDSDEITPLLIARGLLIDNISYVISSDFTGLSVTFVTNRDAVISLSEVTLYYDDGTGLQSIEMEPQYSSYFVNIGPFDPGKNITFYIEATDQEGILYKTDYHSVLLGGSIDILTIGIIGGVAAAAILGLIVVRFRKR